MAVHMTIAQVPWWKEPPEKDRCGSTEHEYPAAADDNGPEARLAGHRDLSSKHLCSSSPGGLFFGEPGQECPNLGQAPGRVEGVPDGQAQ